MFLIMIDTNLAAIHAKRVTIQPKVRKIVDYCIEGFSQIKRERIMIINFDVFMNIGYSIGSSSSRWTLLNKHKYQPIAHNTAQSFKRIFFYESIWINHQCLLSSFATIKLIIVGYYICHYVFSITLLLKNGWYDLRAFILLGCDVEESIAGVGLYNILYITEYIYIKGKENKEWRNICKKKKKDLNNIIILTIETPNKLYTIIYQKNLSWYVVYEKKKVFWKERSII